MKMIPLEQELEPHDRPLDQPLDRPLDQPHDQPLDQPHDQLQPGGAQDVGRGHHVNLKRVVPDPEPLVREQLEPGVGLSLLSPAQLDFAQVVKSSTGEPVSATNKQQLTLLLYIHVAGTTVWTCTHSFTA